MASLNMFIAPATAISSSSTTTSSITTTTTSIGTTKTRRVRTLATATKGSGGSNEEKGFLEWLAVALQKDDGFLETDPLLQKVEGKTTTTTSDTRTVSGKKAAAAPPKKSGGDDAGGFAGFGGLFSKK